MQISNLVGQYNNAVSQAEPISGTKGTQNLVSSLSELSKDNVFEGTVNSVKNGQVKLALPNGQQISARLDGKVNIKQGQSMFFQVKSNNGTVVEIKPYTVGGTGANLTLLQALQAAGLPTGVTNLSMVNKMMEEQMSIDRNSLNQMYHLAQANSDVDVTTLVQMQKLGIPVNPSNAAQFENYLNDKQAITQSMNDLISLLPETFVNENISGENLVKLSTEIMKLITEGLPENVNLNKAETEGGNVLHSGEKIQNITLGENASVDSGLLSGKGENIIEVKLETGAQLNLEENIEVSEGENKEVNKEVNIADGNVKNKDAVNTSQSSEKQIILPNTLADILDEDGIKEINNQINALLPDIDGNEISMYSKESSVVSVLNDIQNLVEQTSADRKTILELFSGKEFKALVRNAIEQQWMIKPEELGLLTKDGNKLSKLYEKVEDQINRMENIVKASGQNNENITNLAANIRGNIEFMNQINEVYTYVQIPLKMNGQSVSGELYVYTNKKNMNDSDRELSAFLHLDLDNLGATDVSVKMFHKEVTTNFYLENDEAFDLVKQFLPMLDEKLKSKGYNSKTAVINESGHTNFVDDFLKKDLPAKGQVHRYSFDMRA